MIENIRTHEEGTFFAHMQSPIYTQKYLDAKKGADELFQPYLGFYRTYSEMQLASLKRVLTEVEKGEKPKNISNRTILACVNG